MSIFSKTFTILLAPALFFVLVVPAHAQSPSITTLPVVINEKAKARDIVTKTIMVTNTSNRMLKLYPSVNNIDPNDGDVEFEVARGGDDLAASLANWIELSRGVIEIRPGEERSIPFVVRVNLNAVPGMYHAHISFSEGSTRNEAEARGSLASVTVNLEVLADIKEILQLNRFSTDNMFFSGDDVLFNYHIENVGNQSLQPKGEIRIYNRKGEEVAAIDVNRDGKAFAPDQLGQLASVWSAVDGFGRFKAHLNLEYGSTQRASVQDTVFFWIIPLKQILGLFAVSLVGIVFFSFSFHKWLDRRHRLALATVAAPQEPMTMLPPEPHDLLPPHEDTHEPSAPGVPSSETHEVPQEKTQEKPRRSGFTPSAVEGLIPSFVKGFSRPWSWRPKKKEAPVPLHESEHTQNVVPHAESPSTALGVNVERTTHDANVAAHRAARPAVAPLAGDAHEAPRRRSASLREAIPNSRTHPERSRGIHSRAHEEDLCGDTIDLKKFCKPKGEVGVEHHHIVDLKKR